MRPGTAVALQTKAPIGEWKNVCDSGNADFDDDTDKETVWGLLTS